MIEIAEMPEMLAALGLIAAVSLNQTESKIYLYLIKSLINSEVKETINNLVIGNPMIELMLKGALATIKEKAIEAQANQGTTGQGSQEGLGESSHS
jgi:hypothetical protein